jgi:hypothetical protein
MNTPQQIRLELQAAMMRREWAIKLRELRGGSPDLDRLIDESTKTLAKLAAAFPTQH